MGEKHEQFRQLKKELADINTQRGGGPDGVKGFYAEHINSTYGNLERIEKGIGARENVIDDNGDWDSVVRYVSGASGRPIQDKVGYTFSYYKSKILTNQYDGGVLRINPDNQIFSDEKRINELKEIAKEHGIKIVKGSVSEKEVKTVAIIAGREGKVRAAFGMEQKAPLTAELYSDSKEIAYAVESVKEKVTEGYDATANYISENVVKLNENALEQAKDAACFAAVYSVTKNAISVIKGEENVDDAAKEVLIDTASAAALAYVTTDLMDKLQLNNSEATLLVNGTIQMSKQLIAYVNGEVDEAQLIENVAETTAYLATAYVGKMIGGAIGSAAGPLGEMIGAYIGEMITTAVCYEVISTLKFNKEFEKQNNRMKSLYRNAEREIRNSQARLEQLIQKENEELKNAIRLGFDDMVNGIRNNSYEQIENGIIAIGEKFNLSVEEIQKDKVTRNTLFQKEEELILE